MPEPMSEEELADLEKRLALGFYASGEDVSALLAEVRRLRAELATIGLVEGEVAQLRENLMSYWLAFGAVPHDADALEKIKREAFEAGRLAEREDVVAVLRSREECELEVMRIDSAVTMAPLPEVRADAFADVTREVLAGEHIGAARKKARE